MKILTLLFLLVSFTAGAQNFDVLPTADTVLSTDKMLIRPLSTTSPALRRITLEQLKRFVNRGVTAADTTKWSLTGNAGTNPENDFCGTSDSTDFIIGANGQLYAIVRADGSFYSTRTYSYSLTTKGKNIIGAISNNDARRQGYMTLDTGTVVIGAGRTNGNTNPFVLIRVQQDTNSLITTLSSIRLDSSIVAITGNLKIINGTQAAGYVLTSDADGNASWQVLALTDTATLDFGTIAPNGHETLTITVAGAALGDVVSLGIPNSSVNDHGAYMAWVSATDTVSIKCFNFDGSGFDPAEGVFKVKVFK